VETQKEPTSISTVSWPELAMEAAGLGGFVVGAGLAAIVLEHPNGLVMQTALQGYPVVRHGLLGILMGGYIALIAMLWGNRSGAHINPAVTWSYYALGNIRFKDAVLYTVAQFVGAVSGALLLKAILNPWFGHPLLDYGVTKPMPPYTSVHAFIAEALISFVLMAVTLVVSTSKKWAQKLPLITGVLIALYLTFELPLSGMSLNPARSTAGALAANKWNHLWIYFVAPVGAMLAACALFPKWKAHRTKRPHQAADWKPLPQFPINERSLGYCS
jgi:aquaporin Z